MSNWEDIRITHHDKQRSTSPKPGDTELSPQVLRFPQCRRCAGWRFVTLFCLPNLADLEGGESKRASPHCLGRTQYL